MNAVSLPSSTPTTSDAVNCLQCQRPFLAPTGDPAAVIECPRCGAQAPRGSLAPPAATSPRPSRRRVRAIGKTGLAALLTLGILGGVAFSLQRSRPDTQPAGAATPKPVAAPTETERVRDAVLLEARAAAERALGCPDWPTAQPLLLHGDSLAPVMARYHTRHPWIPLRLDGRHHGTLSITNGRREVRLTTRTDRGSVVSLRLVDTPEGWKLDWEDLVHARQFAWDRFHEDKPDSPVAVHVLARRGSATDAFFTSAGLTQENGFAVLLDGPQPGQPVLAIVPKASDLGRRFQRDLTWEHPRPYRCLLRFADPALYPSRVEITEFSGEGWGE